MSANSGIQETITSLIDEKIAPLDPPKKVAIWVIGLLIPCVAFYFLYYSGKMEEIEKLEKKQAKLTREIDGLKRTTKNIEQHRAEMKEVEKMFDIASRLLPEKQEIPSLLTNISETGRSSGLDFHSFTPRGENKKQFYAEIPVDIKVKCSYHDSGIFLDKISKLDRIVTVSNLDMTSPKRQDGEMELNTSFRLVTYRFLDTTGKKK